MGGDRLHFAQKEEGRVGVIHKIGKLCKNPQTRSGRLWKHPVSWHSRGVFFKRLYVPELHPITVSEFRERKDEAHVFKVYTCYSTRITMMYRY